MLFKCQMKAATLIEDGLELGIFETYYSEQVTHTISLWELIPSLVYFCCLFLHVEKLILFQIPHSYITNITVIRSRKKIVVIFVYKSQFMLKNLSIVNQLNKKKISWVFIPKRCLITFTLLTEKVTLSNKIFLSLVKPQA